jgi:hypothetical protein
MAHVHPSKKRLHLIHLIVVLCVALTQVLFTKQHHGHVAILINCYLLLIGWQQPMNSFDRETHNRCKLTVQPTHTFSTNQQHVLGQQPELN